MWLFAGLGVFLSVSLGCFRCPTYIESVPGRTTVPGRRVGGCINIRNPQNSGDRGRSPSRVPGKAYNTRSNAKSITAKSASPSGVRLLRSPPSASARFFVAMSA